jgi:hypothetical protein
MDRLGGEPEVTHHGDPPLDQGLGQVGHRALELDRVHPALLQEAGGVGDPLLDRALVGPEGHVADQQRVLRAAGHGLRVVEHLVHGDGEGVLVPQLVVGDRVADQEHGDARLVEDLGGGEVVRGEHRKATTLRLPGAQVTDGDRHGSRLLS